MQEELIGAKIIVPSIGLLADLLKRTTEGRAQGVNLLSNLVAAAFLAQHTIRKETAGKPDEIV